MKIPIEDFYAYRRQLPHLRSKGRLYFVTWCLNRSQPDLMPDERGLVVSALEHFNGKRYELTGYVVMNDHVYVLVRPNCDRRLEDIVHSWKSFTAHRLTREYGRRRPVWQHESYDRIVRNERKLYIIMRYILNNPRRRWPDSDSYRWVWSKE